MVYLGFYLSIYLVFFVSLLKLDKICFSPASSETKTRKWLFKYQVKYLGHVVSSKEISMDPGKIATAKEYQVLNTLSEFKKFPVFASYSGRIILDFSK